MGELEAYIEDFQMGGRIMKMNLQLGSYDVNNGSVRIPRLWHKYPSSSSVTRATIHLSDTFVKMSPTRAPAKAPEPNANTKGPNILVISNKSTQEIEGALKAAEILCNYCGISM
jgi:hypothetical protein